MTPSPARPLSVLAAALASALYFLASCTVTLEWVDEGHLVYQAWQVAQGDVPYRDFQHMYGPGVFLFNGLLLRLFGSDLLVIRLSIVVLKAVTAALVYAVARRVASPPFALVAYMATVIVCGGPWWVFNAPYATHYALALSLLGLLLYLRVGGTGGAALAGGCWGIAAIFKQTTGLFTLASLVLGLTAATWGEATGARMRAGRAVSLLRGLAVLAASAVFIAYVAPHNTVWGFIALLGPLLLGCGAAAWRVLRNHDPVGPQDLYALMAAGASMAVPLALCIVAFGAVGQLSSLVTDTVTGLPRVIRWFVPLALPDSSTTVLVLGLICLLGGLRLGTRRRIIGLSTCAIGLGACAVAASGTIGTRSIMTYVRTDAWIGDVFRIVFVIPFLTAWGAMLSIVIADATDRDDAARPTEAQVLCGILAASGLVALYPAADFWHLVMAWPIFMPALAWMLERLCRGSDRRIRLSLAVVTGFVLAMCATPFLHAVVGARLSRPAVVNMFSRASSINDGSQKVRDAADLVNYLAAQPGDRRMLSVGEGPMLYFLAGRRAIFEREEFVLYLVATGFIDNDDARAWAPEGPAIERIAGAHPLIVVADQAPAAARFRAVFSQVAAYIDAHYQTVATFGGYRVLTWSDA